MADHNILFGPMPLPVTISRCKKKKKKEKKRFLNVTAPVQISSSERGGKVANAALPPFIAAVKLQRQFSSSLRGGKVENGTIPTHIAPV